RHDHEEVLQGRERREGLRGGGGLLPRRGVPGAALSEARALGGRAGDARGIEREGEGDRCKDDRRRLLCEERRRPRRRQAITGRSFSGERNGPAFSRAVRVRALVRDGSCLAPRRSPSGAQTTRSGEVATDALARLPAVRDEAAEDGSIPAG